MKPSPGNGRSQRPFCRLPAIEVRSGEWPALLWSFAYFFCLLSAYYVLRPVRDTMGIAGGVENLPWMFSATFIAMLAVVPIFGWITARFERRVALPAVYLFFLTNLLLFYFLFRQESSMELTARAFFVWLSVFNLFVVSVFWSFMVDIFDSGQAKRLFGMIAAGGSSGAIVGPFLTAMLVTSLGTTNLLLVAVLLLTGALVCLMRLSAWAKRDGAREQRPLGGGAWQGLAQVCKSPYLLGVCAYVLLYTTLSTFLYFTQAELVESALGSADQRTRLFALIDLSTNVLTVGLQLFVTGAVATRLGVSVLLAVVPALVVLGFAVLGVYPSLMVLALVQVLRRAGNYAFCRPGREMLFSVVSRTDKYKSKNFIDTVVYRGGDAVSAWVFAGLKSMGLGVAGIAWIAAPLAAVWAWCGWRLGKHHFSRSRAQRAGSREPKEAYQL